MGERRSGLREVIGRGPSGERSGVIAPYHAYRWSDKCELEV